jgi:hypothetical protein
MMKSETGEHLSTLITFTLNEFIDGVRPKICASWTAGSYVFYPSHVRLAMHTRCMLCGGGCFIPRACRCVTTVKVSAY